MLEADDKIGVSFGEYSHVTRWKRRGVGFAGVNNFGEASHPFYRFDRRCVG